MLDENGLRFPARSIRKWRSRVETRRYLGHTRQGTPAAYHSLISVKGAPLNKPRLLLSVMNEDNDYQIEQVNGARQAAARCGADIEVFCAQDDGILQSQQLLERIQCAAERRPDIIIFEPAGSTTLPRVARAAAAAGIGWAVLSRDADYIPELRSAFRIPAFVVTPDHQEMGRIQGRQLAALLPGGGIVLYILGPTHSKAAGLRQFGLLETKPENIQVRAVKGHWTETSAGKAVHSWLSLSTSRTTDIAAVCAQDDSMAIGARKAFEQSSHELRQSWRQIPFLGCDGMPHTGQEWLRRGLLAATVFNPPTAPVAIDMVAAFLRTGTMPPPRTLTEARSIPEVAMLVKAQGAIAR